VLIGADVPYGTLKGVLLYVRAVRQGTLRLPLGGGKVALMNVNRQPTRRSRDPFTTCRAASRTLSQWHAAKRSMR
jgi:hypothetical protein